MRMLLPPFALVNCCQRYSLFHPKSEAEVNTGQSLQECCPYDAPTYTCTLCFVHPVVRLSLHYSICVHLHVAVYFRYTELQGVHVYMQCIFLQDPVCLLCIHPFIKCSYIVLTYCIQVLQCIYFHT